MPGANLIADTPALTAQALGLLSCYVGQGGGWPGGQRGPGGLAMGKAFLITADLPESGTRHLSREGDPGRGRCPSVTPVWFLWLVGEGSGMLRSSGLVTRSEFREALGYFVSPVEGCPGPSLGNIPRILWLVRGRGCPSSEAWSGGGLHYGWYLVQRVGAEEELGPGWVGGPAVCGGHSPSAGASWAVVCGVGCWGIC